MEPIQMGVVEMFVIGLAVDGPSGSGEPDNLRQWMTEERMMVYVRRVLKQG